MLTTYTTPAKTEGSALRRLIRGMQEAGWRAVAYSDGEGRHQLETPNAGSIAAFLMETEQSWLYWKKDFGGPEHKGTMMFVLGNAPHEVMADSSTDGGIWDYDLYRVENAINLEGV